MFFSSWLAGGHRGHEQDGKTLLKAKKASNDPAMAAWPAGGFIVRDHHDADVS